MCTGRFKSDHTANLSSGRPAARRRRRRRRRCRDMHDDDEYESLPETAGPQIHMIAGATAGMLEHCVVFPFDTVKVGGHVL